MSRATLTSVHVLPRLPVFTPVVSMEGLEYSQEASMATDT